MALPTPPEGDAARQEQMERAVQRLRQAAPQLRELLMDVLRGHVGEMTGAFTAVRRLPAQSEEIVAHFLGAVEGRFTADETRARLRVWAQRGLEPAGAYDVMDALYRAGVALDEPVLVSQLEAYRRQFTIGYDLARREEILAEHERLQRGMFITLEKQVLSEREARAALQRRQMQLELSAELARAGTATRDLNQIIEHAVRQLQTGFGLDFVGIYLLDESRQWATLRAGAGEAGAALAKRGYLLQLDSGSFLTRVKGANEPLLLTEGKYRDEYFAQPILPATRLIAVSPLVTRGETRGFWIAHSEQLDTLTEQDLPILTLIAGNLASAIENAELFSRATSSLYELERVQRGYIREAWTSRELNTEILYSQKEDLFDLEPSWQRPNGDESKQDESSAPLTLPITLRGQVIGNVDLFDVTQKRAWTENEKALASSVVEEMAMAVENARLFEQSQRRAQETELLNQLARDLSGQLVSPQIYQTVHEYLPRLMQMDAFIVWAYDEAQGTITRSVLYDRGVSLPTEAAPRSPTGHYELGVKIEEPLVVNRTRTQWEILKTSGLQQGETRDPSGSLLYVPMSVGGHLWGVMSVQTLEFNAYGPRQLALLTSVANHVVSALENVRLFGQTQEALTETQTLYDINTRLNAASTLDELLAASAAPALDTGARSVLMLLAERDAQDAPVSFRLAASIVPEGARMPLGTPFPLSQFAIGWRFFENPTTVVFAEEVEQDPQLDQVTRALLLRFGDHAMIMLPLTRENRLLGIIMYNWKVAREFTPNERRLYTAVASQLALALNNRLLFQETQSALAETQLLYSIGEHLNQVTTLEELVRVAAQPAFEQGANLAQLFLLDYQDQAAPVSADIVVSLAASGEIAPETGATHYSLGLYDFAKIMLENPGQPILLENVQTHPLLDEPSRRVLLEVGALAFAILPMSVEQRLLGGVLIGWPTPREFAPRERRMYQALASQLAIVLNNRLLFEQTQAALAETRTLYEVGVRLNAATDLSQALEAASMPAVENGADTATLLTLETDAQERPAWGTVVASWMRTGELSAQMNIRFPLAHMPLSSLWIENPTEPLLIQDIETDSRVDDGARALYRRSNVRATALLPLRVGQRWIALLVFGWSRTQSFTARDERLYRADMTQAATVLDNRRLLEQTEQALAETQTLYEISARLNAANTIQEALEAAAGPAIVRGAFTASLLRLYFDASGEPTELEFSAQWPRNSAQQIPLGTRYPREYISAGPAWLANPFEPVLIENVETDARLSDAGRAGYLNGGIHCAALLPLRVGERWIGVLNFNWKEPRAFTARETRLFRSIMAQAATVLDNRSLFEQTQVALQQTQTALAQVEQAQQRLDLQYRTARVLAESASFDTALPELLELNCEQLDWQIGEFWRVDPAADKLRLQYCWSEASPQLEIFTRDTSGLAFGRGEGMSGKTWATAQPLWIPDIEQDSSFRQKGVASQAGLMSGFAFPLMLGESVFGVTVFFSTRAQAMDEPLIATMLGVGRQMAQFIERRRAEEAVRQQNTYLTALHDTTLGLMRRLDLQELLQNIIVRAGELVGTEHGYVHLVESTGSELQMRVGIGIYQDFVGTRVKRGQGLAGTVWQQDEPIVVDDYRRWAGRLPMVDRDALRAVVGVPLRSGDQTVGVIGLASLDEDRVFGSEQIEAIKRFAELASVALDNAQLHESTQQALAQTRRVAEREKTSAEIADRLYAAPDVKAVLRTAAEELRRSTGSRRAVVRLNLGKNGEAKTESRG